MSLKTFITIVVIFTILSWSSFGLIVTKIDPTETTWLAVGLFYLVSFLALAGTFTILGFVLRYYKKPEQIPYVSAITSVRQSIWLTLIVLIALALEQQQLLTWWNIALFILALLALEFFFLSYKNREGK